MKHSLNILLIFNFILLTTNCKSQNKTQPFKFEAAYTSDISANINGGIQQKGVYLGNIDLKITFDTKKAKLWKGGLLHIYGLNNHGESLSDLVGDVQVTSNIEARQNTRLYQLWYSQLLGKFELTIGQHDLNSEFAIPDGGINFVHSSFGIQPDIANNVPASIFPLATLGFIAKWNSSNKLTILAAIYDGNPGDEKENPHSINWKINKNDGAMTIFELQYNNHIDSITRGSYKIGLWHHTANVTSEDLSFEYKNNQGIYFITEQTIFREKAYNQQGLRVFLQIGLAPKKTNIIQSYCGVGLLYRGLINKRDNDDLGIAIGNALLNNNINTTNRLNYESVIEVTYKATLNSHLSLQPNIQYVINPGGFSKLENALISTLRLKLEF